MLALDAGGFLNHTTLLGDIESVAIGVFELVLRKRYAFVRRDDLDIGFDLAQPLLRVNDIIDFKTKMMQALLCFAFFGLEQSDVDVAVGKKNRAALASTHFLEAKTLSIEIGFFFGVVTVK